MTADRFDRIRAGITGARPPRALRYGLAAAGVTAIAILRAALFDAFPAWFLFTPAVVVIALFLGGGAGLLAALLATLSAAVVLLDVEPVGTLSPMQWAASGAFALTNLGLVGLAAALRHALRRADAAHAELTRAAAQAAEREAFLASVLASSTDCIKVLDLDGRLTFMTEEGQRVMEVSDFSAVAGCPWPDFWSGRGHAEATAAVEAARAGRASSFVDRTDTMRGNPRWWHVAVSPILGPDGAPDRILSVSRDISGLRESERERDRFVRLAENSTDFIGMAHVDGRVFYMNDAARRLVGLQGADVTKLAIVDFFPPEQVAIVAKKVLPAVDRDGHWAGELTFRHFGTGELIPVLYSVFPVTDPDGKTFGYGTVTRDFRARKRAEEDLRLMNGELAHRLKNVLAVVQSVAQQTLRNASDTRVASRDLSARLVALSTATDLLTRTSWRSADLAGLARGALAPHGDLGRRILLDGPAVTLQPQAAVAMALALHELATNAAKYGALSNEAGTVAVRWRVDGAGPEAAFHLSWRESGGPPVLPPSRRGFGSTLIERSLRSYFGAAASAYEPDGLEFTVDASMGGSAFVREGVQP